ncbi:VRR-NUC domain containing protein [uncultured Caudovirales phage]|uniref:VRR-NUC domain containing protein n=1 Tax=uncultured Caudovirales phage TaxID=2100421 RepID=A0A6J5LJC1_9CAUD|nr:VRR-NUC domain containing protein [uncultured Caudovirales phage]
MEKHIERHLVQAVKRLGGTAYKFSSPSHRGVSDRVVCLPGQTWFVELKQASGKLSPLQKLFAEDMKRLGQNYACLWSKEDVDKWISDLTKKPAQISSSSATEP